MIHPPQEPDIVPGRKIAVVGAGTVIATIIGVLVAYGIGSCRLRGLGLELTEAREPVRDEVNAIERSVFVGEAQGLEDHRRVEAVLGSYGWVDRQQQIVRIPIERAYAIVQARQRTRAARGQPRGAKEAPQGQQARQRPPGPQRPSAPPRTPEPRDPLDVQAEPGGQR
jgi:hypothetical protein